LKTYKVKYALPNLTVLKDDLTITDMKISDNLYCCGDHLLNGSINAAMKSGRLLADLIILECNKNKLVISITAVVLWQYFLTILITLNIAVVKLRSSDFSLDGKCNIYYAGKLLNTSDFTITNTSCGNKVDSDVGI
jgi:hypothetical protein